jgi:hypothetical protein
MLNRLTTAQVTCAAAYALIFPISNLIGGMLAVAIFGSELAIEAKGVKKTIYPPSHKNMFFIKPNPFSNGLRITMHLQET